MSTDADLPEFWPAGTDRIWLTETGSTMTDAARLGPSIIRPTWIATDRQSAGRGRRGRAWAAGEGNLYATLVLPGRLAPQAAALRSFSAATALLEAFAFHIDRDRLTLKWPNDVLIDGGKAAGILLEAGGGQTGPAWLSIGIGVNLTVAPEVPDAAFVPTSLAVASGKRVQAADFLALLADHMATEEGILARLGFPPVREKWLRHAARLGETITARTGTEEVTGRFETIDENGQLVLDVNGDERRIAAADVYF